MTFITLFTGGVMLTVLMPLLMVGFAMLLVIGICHQ